MNYKGYFIRHYEFSSMVVIEDYGFPIKEFEYGIEGIDMAMEYIDAVAEE